jgi:hypothetical protein
MMQVPRQRRHDIDRMSARCKLFDDTRDDKSRRGYIGLKMWGYDYQLQRVVSSAYR